MLKYLLPHPGFLLIAAKLSRTVSVCVCVREILYLLKVLKAPSQVISRRVVSLCVWAVSRRLSGSISLSLSHLLAASL